MFHLTLALLLGDVAHCLDEMRPVRANRPDVDGHQSGMTEKNPETPPALDLSEVANEPAEKSIAEEREVVGDEPGGDVGGTVPEDDAQ